MELDMHLKRDRAESFNRIAENYERFRPGYPEALREKIEELAGLKKGAELLEVGVGPGQATRLFINRGYKIVGNEPGEQLRNTAWKSLEMPGELTLEGGNFEDWCPAGRTFDLLYSGSAFHWVDPEKGFSKAAEVLKSSGCIALFWNMFPETTDPVWKEIEKAYAQCAPEIAEKRYKRDFNSTIEKRRTQIEQTNLFTDLQIHHFPWSRTFSPDEFFDLHMTYSDHILMQETQRKKLFEKLREVINNHGGTIIRPWDAVLFFASKKTIF